MKYVITKIPDVEELVVQSLREFLLSEVRVQNIFRNVKSVRVSPVHPFAYLIDQQVNGAMLPTDLFPSVTVIADTDIKPEAFFATVEETSIGNAEIQDMINNREMYIISDNDLQAIQQYISTQELNGVGISTIRSVTLSIEIWADNVLLKNRIFDLIESYFSGAKRVELWNNKNILIHEESIQGNRSGNYNFDFGKILFGGVVTCRADYMIEQIIFDTDITDAKKILHTYKEIKNG